MARLSGSRQTPTALQRVSLARGGSVTVVNRRFHSSWGPVLFLSVLWAHSEVTEVGATPLFKRCQRNGAPIGAPQDTRNGQAQMHSIRLLNPHFRSVNPQLCDSGVQPTLVFESDTERLR